MDTKGMIARVPEGEGIPQDWTPIPSEELARVEAMTAKERLAWLEAKRKEAGLPPFPRYPGQGNRKERRAAAALARRERPRGRPATP